MLTGYWLQSLYNKGQYLTMSGDNFSSQGPDLSAGCADGSCSIAQGVASAPTSGSRTSDVEQILSMISSSSNIVHSSEAPCFSRQQEDASSDNTSISGFHGQRMAVLERLMQISEGGSSSNLGQVSKAWEFCSVHLNASFPARSSITSKSLFHTNSQQHPFMGTIACLHANSSRLRHLTAIGSIDSTALPLEASMLLVVILITEWGMAQVLTGYLPCLVLFSPPIQKELSKQHLGSLRGFSSLGIVLVQKFKDLMLFHVHCIW